MLTEGLFSLAALFCLLLYYFIEYKRHERSLAAIPLRIHVNGIRGKSSVTRLIAAGLRAGGLRVVAKTTGTRARILLPDGSEQDLKRRGPANIKEMIPVTRRARSLGAQALVAECMAVRPDLQWCCEHRLIKAHIGVITNIRPDHEDVMGTGLENIARSLCNTAPEAGVLVTTCGAAELVRSAMGQKAESQLVTVDGGAIGPEELSGFPYEVIGENLALALAVCELAGVDRQTALNGMRQAQPDPGNVTVRAIRLDTKTVTLVNAFAANDPESTLILWNRYVASRHGSRAILLNCRRDRKYRTAQLCRELAKVHQGSYIVTGDTAFARPLLVNCGISPRDICILPAKPRLEDLALAVQSLPGEDLTVFGAGNAKGVYEMFATPDGGWLCIP